MEADMIPNSCCLSEYLVTWNGVSEGYVGFCKEEAIHTGGCCHVAEVFHLLELVRYVNTVRILKIDPKHIGVFCGG